MKRTLLTLFLVIPLVFSAVAQDDEGEEMEFQREPGFYAGVEIGVTYSKFKGLNEGEFDNHRFRPGIMMFGKLTYVVNNHFMATFETGWNQQGLLGDDTSLDGDGSVITNYRLDYWESNLLAEFGLPSEMIIPYFFVGPSFGGLGNAQAISQSSAVDIPGSSANSITQTESIRQNLRLYDFAVIGGFGIRANFWENLMINLSARYREGVLDIGGSQFIEPINNRSFSISLGAVYALPF
jgi:hypothetical protein